MCCEFLLGFYTFSRRGHFFFAECPQTNTSSLRRKGSMKCSTHLPCHLDLVIVRWHQCALCRPYPSPFITLIYNIKICTAAWLLLHISQKTLTLTARPLPPCSPWLRCDAISHAQPRPAQLPPHRLGPLPELVRPVHPRRFFARHFLLSLSWQQQGRSVLWQRSQCLLQRIRSLISTRSQHY